MTFSQPYTTFKNKKKLANMLGVKTKKCEKVNFNFLDTGTNYTVFFSLGQK